MYMCYSNIMQYYCRLTGMNQICIDNLIDNNCSPIPSINYDTLDHFSHITITMTYDSPWVTHKLT